MWNKKELLRPYERVHVCLRSFINLSDCISERRKTGQTRET